MAGGHRFFFFFFFFFFHTKERAILCEKKRVQPGVFLFPFLLLFGQGMKYGLGIVDEQKTLWSVS